MIKYHFSASGNLKRNIACKGMKRHLQAIAKGRGLFSSRRKAQGCGGKDSGDGGHGHNSKRVSVTELYSMKE